jgi:hypothetical protein
MQWQECDINLTHHALGLYGSTAIMPLACGINIYITRVILLARHIRENRGA